MIRAWQKRLRTFCFDHWPWLQDEIAGLAEGAGIETELAELLSFRAWQYEVYHAGSCSSFALPDAAGKIQSGKEAETITDRAPTPHIDYRL